MNKRILIIDDDEDVKEIIQMGLEMAANWHVITASTGTEGLKLAQGEQPDVILLDLMMPQWMAKKLLSNSKPIAILLISP